MKNQPLIATAAFTLAALVFLLWAWGNYRAVAAEADDAVYDWETAVGGRQSLVDLLANPELSQGGAATGPAEDVPAVMSKLITDCGMRIEQLDRIDPAGAIGSEASASAVKLSDVSIATMGAMLERIRLQHKGLTVREISMTEGRNAAPGQFNWSLIIGVPKATK